MSQVRNFLFLQGVCSPFFTRLADRLKAKGHRVFKVNFNAGDWVTWSNHPSWNYRGHASELGDFLDTKCRKFEITDQILFGDCRPVHRPAVSQARANAVRTHVFEEAYFRPFWVTLEREGVNAHSLLPRDPDWYRQVGANLPDHSDSEPFQTPFKIRAIHDIYYHTAGIFNPFFYPGYRTHTPVNAPVEYFGYACRLPMLRFHERKDTAVVNDLVQNSTPFFLLPLQLDNDSQIRDHSPFDDMADVMEFVMKSFAHHAPRNAKLVIKNHPLDMGLVNYPRLIRRLSKHLGLEGRVEYIETGNLDTLLRHTLGTVTVNSTVGGLSLGLNRPTIALSTPIYNLPGLTFQGDLDDFWQNRHAPDSELFRCFRNTVIHATQINGGFYCAKGIDLAVQNSIRILESERSPLQELL
jgi:capsular polysaccharide export protein